MAEMASWLQMNTGVKVSGAVHLGLILWMMVGGVFSFERDTALEVADVSVISSEQFAAMMAARSQAPDVAEAAPEAPDVSEAAETPDTPAPEEAPEVQARPEAAEADAPEAEPETAERIETPDAEVTPIAPPLPDQPDLPDGASTVFAPDTPPAPQAAPRVAPLPADRPDPDANIADDVQQAARREDGPEAPPVPDAPEETTAPEESGTVIETEATEEAGGTAVAALAPPGSPRPQRRPNRPAPAPQPPAEPQQQAEPARDPLADAIAGAVAEAATTGAPSQGQGRAPSGPPLTFGETEGLRIAMKQCWNVGALSTDALRTTVTVYVLMNENGTPDGSSIRLVGREGGTEAGAQQAFEVARRAILRCGARGFDLPVEKYDHWREIEMVFNPDGMRLR